MRTGFLVAIAVLTSWCQAALMAYAHNAYTHLEMTDYAYRIMVSPPSLAPAPPPPAPAEPGPPGSETAPPGSQLDEYLESLKAAAAKFGKLLSGLPPPPQKSCGPIYEGGSNVENTWQNSTPLAQLPLEQIPHPISADYGQSDSCGIYLAYNPGPIFPPSPDQNQYAGTVLGYYATRPDKGFYAANPDTGDEDVHLYIRPLNMLGLSVVKEILGTSVGIAVGTAYVSVKCFLSCTESALTFGLAGDCDKCVHDAIRAGKTAGNKAVEAVTNLVPGFGDFSDPKFTGMPHHVDNVPQAADADVGSYDSVPGLLIQDAGPEAIPDPIEVIIMALMDATGATVKYDSSQMPIRYQMSNEQDGAPDSILRSKDDWEYLSAAHTPMTPVDNLGRYGWDRFRAAPTDPTNLQWLGWPLHAIGDATVPHHVAGTFGWGHRPFEDAASDNLETIFHKTDISLATGQAMVVLTRSKHYYDEIQAWRGQHPATDGRPSEDIPLRQLIREVAALTWATSKNQSPGNWPYGALDSTAYVTGQNTGRYAAPAYLEKTSQMLNEGIALEVAFLLAASDVLP
jgi:hypothetical protein